MITTFQYRLYPTVKQEKIFEEQLDACRQIYNQALAMKSRFAPPLRCGRKEAYEEKSVGFACTFWKESISYCSQAAYLTQLRKKSKYWASFHIDILQDTLRRLDKAYEAFFRRVKAGEKPGYPQFKSEGCYQSVTYSHLSKKLIHLTPNRLNHIVVPKVGKVKIRLHRPLPDGKIKTLQLLRKASGWYANIAVEIPDIPKVEIKTSVGVDVGLESFLTTSDGDKVENPHYLRKAEKELKRKQRLLSKKKKGSNRRKNTRRKVAILHEHITNQRKDFHCKTSHGLYKRYDAIVVEDLQITNMVKNHHLAKSISDAAWGNFILSLESKAGNTGKHLVKVSPKYTSQKCSQCGEIVKKSLSIRTHQCNNCGLVLDRDENAAINILRAATALQGGDGLPSPKN